MTLPAIGSTNHPYYIINTSASYDLTIKDAGGSTIGTVVTSSSGSFASDGTSWHSFGGGAPADITTALVHSAASKSPPVDADEMPLLDSAASYGLKKLTWANIKATIKAYTDTLYTALVAPGTSGNVLTSNGSAWTSAALTAAQLASAVTPGTSGNVLTSNGSAWTSATPTGGASAGYLFGLTLANNATDATNDIDIATGKCRDGADGTDIVLSTALTKRLDAAWAVGTNQGGLDTGSIANTTYHVWIIKRSDTGVVDALFSTSASAPTMPTNYDLKRRIGSIIRKSAAILSFRQIGDDFFLDVPVMDVDTSNPGTSAVTSTLTCPVGIVTQAKITASVGIGVGGSSTFALVTSLNQTDTTPSATLFNVMSLGNSTINMRNMATLQVPTNTSAQVRYRLSVSSALINMEIITQGWIDTRGRFA